MGILALLSGILGGISAVMGILTIMAVIPQIMEFTWMFWMMLGVILMLGCIAFNLCNSGGNYE